MANLTPINLDSLSFETILGDLKAWLDSKPDGAAWKDFYDSSDGTIIAEWMAGLATFRAYQELVRVRESQIDNAQLTSSVYELAFNRGLMIPPGTAPEMLLTIEETTTVSVDYGDYVGTCGSYELYSLEAKTLNPGSNTLRVVAGHLNEFTQQISSLPKFKTFQFTTKDVFLAVQLERFTANTLEISLQSDPNYLAEIKNNFLLRRTLPGLIKIYVGNGVLGWYQSNTSAIQYRVLSYAEDVMTTLSSLAPTLLIQGLLTERVVDVAPTYASTKEDIRSVARFYPLDGRIVTDVDYEVMINKYYGGLVYDVYSYNNDPRQQIYLLKRPAFDSGAGGSSANLAEIRARIDSKRTLGMPVDYHLVEETQGLVFTPTMRVPLSAYTNELASQVSKYLAVKCFKFLRESRAYTAVDLATELSAKFSVQFLPVDPTASVIITPQAFYRVLTTPLIT